MLNSVEHQVAINPEIGTAFFYWESKNGRLFLASQVMKALGYNRSSSNVISYHELLVDIDYIKLSKQENKELFKELETLNVLQSRATHALFVSETGFWKLVIGSKKRVGIQTRHWLATQVLPSIREKGYYDANELNSSPLNHLSKFTERPVQIQTSKNVNQMISQTDEKAYAQYWNDLHKLVTGMTAKQIQELYKSKKSATELLRQYAPHLQATESCINDIYKAGIGLERVRDSGLHATLPPAIDSLFKLGIKLEDL